MADFKIDRDMKLPKSKSKYPFADMSIGDSFFFPSSVGQQVRTSAHAYRARTKEWNFEIRREDSGYRIWRTA